MDLKVSSLFFFEKEGGGEKSRTNYLKNRNITIVIMFLRIYLMYIQHLYFVKIAVYNFSPNFSPSPLYI